MAFNIDNFYSNSTLTMVSFGIPGTFGYSTPDTVDEVLTPGYFPPADFYEFAITGDLILVSAADGSVAGFFDSNYNLIDVSRYNRSTNVITLMGASYNLVAPACYILNNSSSAIYTLPDATQAKGKEIILKKISGLLEIVTINPQSGQTIDGASSYSMVTQYSYVKFISDGSNWYII